MVFFIFTVFTWIFVFNLLSYYRLFIFSVRIFLVCKYFAFLLLTFHISFWNWLTRLFNHSVFTLYYSGSFTLFAILLTVNVYIATSISVYQNVMLMCTFPALYFRVYDMKILFCSCLVGNFIPFFYTFAVCVTNHCFWILVLPFEVIYLIWWAVSFRICK